MSLEQIRRLHERPGESIKERRKLAKHLTMDELNLALEDAVINSKSVIPFGGDK